MLLSNDVEDGFLDVKEAVFGALHVDHLFGRDALHFDHLVAASAIVERIRAFREVVHDIVRIQHGNPGRIVPRDGQRVVRQFRVVQHGSIEGQEPLPNVTEDAIRFFVRLWNWK